LGWWRAVEGRRSPRNIALESSAAGWNIVFWEAAHLQPTESPPLIDMPASRENRILVFCLLLVAATLAFYNPVVRNQFVDFDDLSYIQKNNHVLAGVSWDTVKWSFTTFRDGNWHPLTWLSHALDCQVFHLNPIGHHYTNLLLHAANAVLLFLLLQRATGFTWSSLVVGALFPWTRST